MGKLQFVFVHGLSGWGSYDGRYRRMPYWGMRGGDLMVHLRKKGFDCFAASVAPTGSAWDRACELYAQIDGTRTDYGAASKPLDRAHIEPGIWNVFPTFDGDHMALQGGLTIRHEIRGFYEELLTLIESL